MCWCCDTPFTVCRTHRTRLCLKYPHTSDHHGGGLLDMVILVLEGHSHASFVKHRRTLCKLTHFPYRWRLSCRWGGTILSTSFVEAVQIYVAPRQSEYLYITPLTKVLYTGASCKHKFYVAPIPCDPNIPFKSQHHQSISQYTPTYYISIILTTPVLGHSSVLEIFIVLAFENNIYLHLSSTTA